MGNTVQGGIASAESKVPTPPAEELKLEEATEEQMVEGAMEIVDVVIDELSLRGLIDVSKVQYDLLQTYKTKAAQRVVALMKE